jgi:hypothetical protein
VRPGEGRSSVVQLEEQRTGVDSWAWLSVGWLMRSRYMPTRKAVGVNPGIHASNYPDPNPAIFITDLQDANKKLRSFPVYYFFKVLIHHFQR